MTLQTVFGVLVVLYSVANLASMGLELNLRETIKSLRSARLVVLTLVWGWVVGPAFAVSAHEGPAAGGAACHRAAHLQPGADRAIPAHPGQKSPRRHGLRRRPHAAGDGRHGGVAALDGAVADHGADGERLVAGQTASPAGPAAAGGVRRDQGLRRAGGGQAVPGGQAARGDLHAADPRVHRGVLFPGFHPHRWAALPSARKSSSSSGWRSCPISSASA